MASQQYYQPQKGRRDTDEDVYDNAGNAPSIPKGSSQGLAASQSAQDSLDDIDNVLREQEQSGGFYKSGGEDADKKKLSGDDLQEAESTKKPKADPETVSSGTGKSSDGRKAKLTAKVKKLVRNKAAMAVAGVSGVSVVTIILLIILVLGLFKIPNFGEHIATYQFARVTRNMAKTVDSVTATKMAVESADSNAEGTGVWDNLKDRYANSRPGQIHAQTAEIWNQLQDKYNPQKIVDNLQRDEKLQFNYTDKSFFRPNGRLSSVTVNGLEVPLKKPTVLSRYVPPVKFINDYNFTKNFVPVLREGLASADVGTIVSGPVQSAIRKQLGVSLIAWDAAKFNGKTSDEAKIAIEQDAKAKIQAQDPVTNPVIDEIDKNNQINKTATAANDATDEALNSTTGAADEIINHPNRPIVKVLGILDSAFKTTFLDQVIGWLNPTYAIAAPMCIVYEGSLKNSGPTINNESAQSQRAFYLVESASSQTKDGYQANGNAVGAFDWKLGAIEQSNPEIRASGGTVDTSQSPSTESAPTGQFSIYDALVPAPFDTILNKASDVCPVFSSVWVGGALALVNVVALIASFGGAAVPEAGGDAAAQVSLREVASQVLSKVAGDETGAVGLKSTGKAFGKFTTKVIATAGATAGATFLAQYIVASQAGIAQSPLAIDTPFDNYADSGGNQNANLTERVGLYGRPLTKDEVALNNVQDQQFVAAQTGSESAISRYLSPSNPDSMIAKVASVVSLHIGGGNFTSLFNIGSSVLNPINAFGSAISSLSASRVGAATTDTFNYGNVQFGFSPAEEAKLDLDPTTNLPQDPSYSILDNQLALDESGAEDAIASKYGPCFDENKQIGDLLTTETGIGGNDKYYIVRDKDGNVMADQGLCSPNNLGMNNQDPAAGYPNGYGDLVFRWRVSKLYGAALDQLDAEQNPTVTEPSAANGNNGQGGVTPNPTGWTFPLNTTQSALVGHNPQWCYQSQDNCHHDFPAADIFTNEGTQVVAAMGGKVIVASEVDTCTTDEGGSSHLQIQGSDGNYYFYTHMEGALQVKVGDTVTAGQALGKVGSAVCAQGTTSHLHIQVANQVIFGDDQNMNIQPQLVAAFQSLPP